MPLTFPAHQAVVLPAKLRWPERFDATALCVGAAMPDLTYPFLGGQGQTLLGGLVVSVPLTLFVCVLLRRGAAAGVVANLPDLGGFRIHSYRVIVSRRPGFATTATSACIGVVSHVVVDSLTHRDRLLARWLGLDRVLFTLPRIHEVDIAKLLQMAGHVGGSAIGLWLLWRIGVRRLLEEWYGTGTVEAARRFTITVRARVFFWTSVVAAAAASQLIFAPVDTRWVFKLMLGAVIGAIAAGLLLGRPVPATNDS